MFRNKSIWMDHKVNTDKIKRQNKNIKENMGELNEKNSKSLVSAITAKYIFLLVIVD